MTPEQIERYIAYCKELEEKDRQMAAMIPDAICSADLHRYLMNLKVIVGGKVGRVDEIKVLFAKEDGGGMWNPVNIVEYQKSLGIR